MTASWCRALQRGSVAFKRALKRVTRSSSRRRPNTTWDIVFRHEMSRRQFMLTISPLTPLPNILKQLKGTAFELIVDES